MLSFRIFVFKKRVLEYKVWILLVKVSVRVLVSIMVFMCILDGNSEIGAHIRSNICYLKGLRQEIGFFPRIDLFLFMREQRVLGYHLI